MRPNAQQIGMITLAFYKAAQDRSVTPVRRLEFRMEARRGRAVVKWLHKLESEKVVGSSKE